MMPEHDLPRPSSMKELGPSMVSSHEGTGLVRKVSWQGNPHPQAVAVPVHHAKSCSSFSTLHTEDPDSTFVKPKRRISFDERVSVREFDSTSCVSLKDLEPPSPVRPVPKVILCTSTRNNENLPMIDVYPDTPPVLRTTPKPCMTLTLDHMLRREIRTILMVDRNDIFLQLFSKRLQDFLPLVQIHRAHSSEEALQILSTTPTAFDVIIAEERLSLFHKHKSGNNLGSGSALLAHLKQHYAQQFHHALVIMVSAHWQADHAAMAMSGADYCWSKVPPPVLTPALLEEMIHMLLHKRGQHELAKEFMVLNASSTDKCE